VLRQLPGRAPLLLCTVRPFLGRPVAAASNPDPTPTPTPTPDPSPTATPTPTPTPAPTPTPTPTLKPHPGQTQLLPLSCTLGISMRAAAEAGFAPSEHAEHLGKYGEQCESCQ